MNNEQLYKVIREIGDLILWTVKQYPDKQVFMEDKRKQSVNGYYNQTQQGIFLELYYGTPTSLWTPWGKWSFGGCGSGDQNPIIEQLTPVLGLKLHTPEINNSMGTYGPVYGITKFKDQILPEPMAYTSMGIFRPYEQVTSEWKDLSDAYILSIYKKLPPTSDDFSELDRRTMIARSEVEGSVRPDDIQSFDEAIQVFKSGDVFKYTQNNGKTWYYTYVGHVSEQTIHTYNEVMAVGVHCSCNFTRDSFARSGVLAFRRVEPEEVETMIFSYEYESRNVLESKSKYKKKVHVKTKEGELKDMYYEEALEAWSKKLADETPSFSEHDHSSGYALWQATFWAEGDVLLCLSTGELLDFTL